MSDGGLLIGAGIVLGGYVGYKIVKATPPKWMEDLIAGAKKGFSQGMTQTFPKDSPKKRFTNVLEQRQSFSAQFSQGFREGFDGV